MSVRRAVQHLVGEAFFPEGQIRKKYAAFKVLLEWDRASHGLMAKLEKIYHDAEPVDFCRVTATYEELVYALSKVLQSLADMAPFSYSTLPSALHHIDSQARHHLTARSTSTSSPYVLALDEIPVGAEHFVGGKAACLSRIGRELQLPVPKGFAVTSNAFHHFLEFNRIRAPIEEVLARLDIASPVSLESESMELIQLILQGTLPPDLEQTIAEYYWRVVKGKPCAVRSSAVSEDSEISFAGQYRSLLNVSSDSLTGAYKQVLASKYSPGALSYRIRHGLLDSETPMAVLVTEMVEPEASGVVYSKNPLSADCSFASVYSVWGTGELLMMGAMAPDVAEVSREEGHSVIRKECAAKETRLVLSGEDAGETPSGTSRDQASISLDDHGARQLTVWALQLESLFGTPQDIEWCKDRQGNLYLLQSRPLRTLELQTLAVEVCQPEVRNSVLLAGGEKAASGVGAGRVVKVFAPSDLNHIPEGSVLVAPTTSPMFAQVIDRLEAVVTDVGSVAGHFASIAREWSIPTLVNTLTATQVLEPGEMVTVDADRGRVLAGVAEELLAFSRSQQEPSAETPLRQRLRSILKFVSPLNLVDPRSTAFAETNCRTFHDLLRFTHEKAVAEMFSLGGKQKRKIRGARKITCDIPIVLYVLDLGGGLSEHVPGRQRLSVEQVVSTPFKALWQGMTDLKDAWSSGIAHLDWNELDRMGMGGGIVSFDSQLLASFVLISSDYLNANIRFGYHFAVVDALLGEIPQDNYVSFNFEGGGGSSKGRHLRALFIGQTLEGCGFEVQIGQDSIHAKTQRTSTEVLAKKLVLIGRLLAFTPLLDMRLSNPSDVERLVDLFSARNPWGGSEIKMSASEVSLSTSTVPASQ